MMKQLLALENNADESVSGCGIKSGHGRKLGTFGALGPDLFSTRHGPHFCLGTMSSGPSQRQPCRLSL